MFEGIDPYGPIAVESPFIGTTAGYWREISVCVCGGSRLDGVLKSETLSVTTNSLLNEHSQVMLFGKITKQTNKKPSILQNRHQIPMLLR